MSDATGRLRESWDVLRDNVRRSRWCLLIVTIITGTLRQRFYGAINTSIDSHVIPLLSHFWAAHSTVVFGFYGGSEVSRAFARGAGRRRMLESMPVMRARRSMT